MVKKLLLLILALLSVNCWADLKLDTSQSPKSVSQLLQPFFNVDANWPYGNESSPEISYLKKNWSWDEPMWFTFNGNTQFAWIFNKKTYLSSVVSFDRKNSIKQENQDIFQLFMFTEKPALTAIAFLKINKIKEQIHGKPYLLFVNAMAVAKEVPDSMLITLVYCDSAEFLTDPHGNPPEYTTTILLRFSEESGKLKIVQDDSCLGNPNQYKTIASARKALKQCVSKNKKDSTH